MITNLFTLEPEVVFLDASDQPTGEKAAPSSKEARRGWHWPDPSVSALVIIGLFLLGTGVLSLYERLDSLPPKAAQTPSLILPSKACTCSDLEFDDCIFSLKSQKADPDWKAKASFCAELAKAYPCPCGSLREIH